jgi:hypothetical protein
MLLVVAALGAVAIVNGAAAASAEGPRLAIAPLKRTVGTAGVAEAIEISLSARLGEYGSVIDTEETRDVLRELRLRDIDSAPPESLARLAEEMGFDWLVIASLHDARSEPVSDLTVSMRFYGPSGEMVWNEFLGRSGLDGETVLGFGVVDSVEKLAPVVVERLLDESPVGNRARSRSRKAKSRDVGALGAIALLPLTSYVDYDALPVADAATEAARVVLRRSGVPLASPSCVRESMRLEWARNWGELPVEARRAMREECGADRILTGAVEQWDVSGTGLVPKPEVSLSLRLLDAESGKILWMESKEATGWDGSGLFGRGRIYSRGALLDDLLTDLTRRLIRSGGDVLARR